MRGVAATTSAVAVKQKNGGKTGDEGPVPGRPVYLQGYRRRNSKRVLTWGDTTLVLCAYSTHVTQMQTVEASIALMKV